MTSTASNIGKQIPGFMALGLVGKSAKMAKNSFDFNSKGKKPKKMDFMKNSIEVLVGVPLITEVSKQVNLIP